MSVFLIKIIGVASTLQVASLKLAADNIKQVKKIVELKYPYVINDNYRLEIEDLGNGN